eukprot:scaffold15965_cov111-Isochrysis_galbana.AAC.4
MAVRADRGARAPARSGRKPTESAGQGLRKNNAVSMHQHTLPCPRPIPHAGAYLIKDGDPQVLRPIVLADLGWSVVALPPLTAYDL